MRLDRQTIFSIVAMLAFATAAQADCRTAVDNYNSATSDIASRLRRYAQCVGDSRGQDDCDSEFRRLKSAQNDFESAVSEHQASCR